MAVYSFFKVLKYPVFYLGNGLIINKIFISIICLLLFNLINILPGLGMAKWAGSDGPAR